MHFHSRSQIEYWRDTIHPQEVLLSGFDRAIDRIKVNMDWEKHNYQFIEEWLETNTEWKHRERNISPKTEAPKHRLFYCSYTFYGLFYRKSKKLKKNNKKYKNLPIKIHIFIKLTKIPKLYPSAEHPKGCADTRPELFKIRPTKEANQFTMN